MGCGVFPSHAVGYVTVSDQPLNAAMETRLGHAKRGWIAGLRFPENLGASGEPAINQKLFKMAQCLKVFRAG